MRSLIFIAVLTHGAWAGVGDPQLGTDHPWYPGELAMSTFDRLFATQAEQYRRMTGLEANDDHHRALASWAFRNTHYAHGDEGREDWWGEGFGKGGDTRSREYWTGLFAHGYGLCGTTHSQWVAEFERLLGPGRARGAGVSGHNSFEAFLTGGPYGSGRWVMLDHDLSTVIFDPQGRGMLGLAEISADWRRLTWRDHAPERQQGWLVSGLHPEDGASYATFKVAEYAAGYAGPPPRVHLRAGEALRRYFEPGLEDGETFVYWGRNAKEGAVPGPSRSRTWVNQPERMHGSTTGTPHQQGQARYGNAVYTWKPDFAGLGYREGLVDEGDVHVTLEFHTPFIIAATPASDDAWAIYQPGCRNGLVLHGKAQCLVALSVDGGASWHEAGMFTDAMDLTDVVKGHRQYLLRLGAAATALASSDLRITTVCQVNPAVLPRLKDDGTRVTFAASHQAVISAGPTLALAQGRVVEGAIGTPRLTMEMGTPRGETVIAIHAAAHVASSSPPDPAITYQIEYSKDGQAWNPLLRDWRVIRQGTEPADFWSQSLCFGEVELGAASRASALRVRFHNNGGKRYLRPEMHLVYQVDKPQAVRVSYAWRDDQGQHQADHLFGSEGGQEWQIPTARQVRTLWVEMEPIQPER